jgi:hypothetical protein
MMLPHLATLFRTLSFTNRWQARCPSCRKTVNLAELGLKRDAPRGLTKHTLGWCRTCRTVRLLHIEPAPPHAAD